MTGGRSHRLNWKRDALGSHFGDYAIVRWPGYETSRLPYFVTLRAARLYRRHGRYEGYQRFASAAAAEKWVERLLAKKIP